MKCLLIKLNGNIIDITNILSEVSFGSSIEQGCRTLEISVANDGTKFDIGDTVNYIDADINYVGQIQKNTNKNKQEILNFEIIDYMSHWTRSETTQIVNSKAENIAAEFCNYFGFAIGSIANTGIATGERAYVNRSFYSIIKDLYDRAGTINGKQYIIRTSGAYFNVYEKGEIIDFKIGDSINLEYVTQEDDMTQLVNKVVIYDDKNKKIGEKIKDTIGVVGIYQKVADKNDNVDEILNDIEHNLIVNSSTGDNKCQSGKYIRFEDSDTNLTGIYEITEDSHTINSNGHKMILRLKFIRLE